MGVFQEQIATSCSLPTRVAVAPIPSPVAVGATPRVATTSSHDKSSGTPGWHSVVICYNRSAGKSRVNLGQITAEGISTQVSYSGR